MHLIFIYWHICFFLILHKILSDVATQSRSQLVTRGRLVGTPWCRFLAPWVPLQCCFCRCQGFVVRKVHNFRLDFSYKTSGQCFKMLLFSQVEAPELLGQIQENIMVCVKITVCYLSDLSYVCYLMYFLNVTIINHMLTFCFTQETNTGLLGECPISGPSTPTTSLL